MKKGTYIQSVIEGSIAENNGIAPNMEILKINDLYFNSESDFCNYLIQKKKDPMRIKLLNQNKDTLNLVLEKSPIISTLIKP
jgi:C-terminal processing protease CtpA/Prc